PDLLESGSTLAHQLADAAVTVLWDRDGMVPLGPNIPVTTLTLADHSGASRYWTALLQEAGCRSIFTLDPSGDAGGLATELAAISGPVLLTICAVAAPWQGLTGWAPQFLEPLRALARRVPLGLVLLGTPYLADALPEATLAICTYAYGAESQQAAMAVLQGFNEAQGKCPVNLKGPQR
ncbi:MAG: hypothetical protein H7338_10955, partial [Candidatus Sericytochromatia bacterium]|nr:hypothetical protein [Candidatus Sericytochromatia bacterium]